MDPAAYHAFADALRTSLEARPEVQGLVAVGSFAEGADAFSDHDFFVIARPDATEELRRDLRWLPNHERVVLALRETAHGVKVVDDTGHLVEFAVFSPDEIALARLNRVRVVFDRADVTARIAAAVRATQAAVRDDARSDAWLVGQFLTAILVGVGRHRRGERLAGLDMVQTWALRHLLVLLARHVAPEQPAPLDDQNPVRRIEHAYPAIGGEIADLVASGDLERTARGLLDVGERLFGRLGGEVAPPAAWATIRRAIGG